MALDMDKPAFTKFLDSMFTTAKTLHVETISVSGSRDFTAWEWKMHFTKNEGLSEFAEINVKESKEGEMLVFVGVSLTWWNEEGKIVKNHDYARLL
jgi:hypothetical protein